MQQDDHCSAHSPEELALFLSGDLSPRRTRDVLRHLPRCSVCQRRLGELATVRDLLRQSPAPSPPRSYTLTPAQVRPRPRILWFPLLRSATIAVAILVLLVFVAGLLSPSSFETSSIGRSTGESPIPGPPTAVVGPVITRRNPPATAIGLVTPLPAYVTGTAAAYPAPSVWTVPGEEPLTPLPGQSSVAPDSSASPGLSLLTSLRLGGLLFLGLLAGLTYLAYRRERPFLS